MMHRAIGLLAFALVAPSAAAQDGENLLPPQAPGFDEFLEQWRQDHGEVWRAIVDPATGHLEMLYGGNAAPHFSPDPGVEADWFNLALDWATVTEPLHGIDPSELSAERMVYLPMGMANGTDKITVRLRQSVLNLPVESGIVNLLFDTGGRLLSVHSTAAPETGHLVLAPNVSGRVATSTAVAAFEAAHGVPAIDIGMPLLQVAQVERAGQRDAVLAYRVEVRNDHEPAGKAYVIDALLGGVLRADELVHHFDVSGTIQSNATPGVQADHGGNPPTTMPMGYIDVVGSNGQTVTTDRDGNFNFPGVNTPLNLTLRYEGTFNEVDNDGGSNYVVTFNNVQPNQANTLTMNPNPSEFVTAQANAYQQVSVLRDYVRDTVPTDNTADFQASSNTNQNSSCNAFFNGNSVNYYRKAGSCNNTAFSTVVAHEMGHWLNVLYSTGNGSDGMGEGNADVWAMYMVDDPIVGSFFFTNGGFVRTGLNTRQFCGDNNGGCYGGVHADGEVWMGAAWKVRRNLKNNLGTALGGATADQLFVGWMNAYNQTQIKSIIETQWLTLDDDNGNIGDGTPNYSEIDAGFLEQGFPGYDLDFFNWSNVTQLPDVSDDVGPYTVNADITAQINNAVVSADLHWSVDDGPTQTVAMSPAGGNTWTGDIPAIGGVGYVDYWLSATDDGGNSEDFPTDGSHLEFTVGDEIVIASYDFEAGNDEGWVGHLGTDTATTGEWERGDPIPTAAQPGDDHTPGAGNTDCWFTGQGSPGGTLGENDVDNGITTLRSPAFDMSGGLSEVRVSYWRWYSNTEGANPNADVFLVQLSNDNGASWTTVETVGPNGPDVSGGWFESSFLADAFLPLTSQMRVQFIAEDEVNQGSIIEAAIDDFEITTLNPGCAPPVNYCVTSPNSVGAGAIMTGFGSQDVNDDAFTLLCTGCPTGQAGLFYYGPTQANVPTGEGVLCVGNPVFRLPAQQIDVFGFAQRVLDFNNLPAGGGIQNGDTMNFAFWYRDPAGGGSGFNFSDGLQVLFCGN